MMIRQFLYATTVGILATNFATADLHVVDLVGLTFVPNEITVAPGDTVRWQLSTGFHTVTSGTNCLADGLWFNEPITPQIPIVTWVVPEAAVGDVLYFCIPHCSFGMDGIIHVVDPCDEDLDGSGAVDVADILIIIGAWGDIKSPHDLDGSGVVDVGDLLLIIGAFGAC